ncbi:MAG: ATP-binding cassette domain-containing protein [Phycisphaerae bacterium]|nr:ATP-binding cassette domain-containing protein [Phycisphaerae bacterium]
MNLGVAAHTGELVIDLENVEKTYKGRIRALRGVSMRVERGAVFGLLGPNGAGKSTLVKILMTVIRASKCRGTMLGSPIGNKNALARVGYLPEHHRFPEYLTARQVLDFYGALARVGRSDRRSRAPELLDLVGLAEWTDKRVRQFSKGMRQRLGIAQALMNNPDLVLLDEPTDGVDPVGRRDIRNVLSHLRDQGKTVLLNSHLLSELEMVCDRVAIMVQGLVTSQGTINELTEGDRRFEIELADSRTPDQPFSADLLAALPPGTRPAMPAAPTSTGAPTGPAPWTGLLPTGERVSIESAMLRVWTDDPARMQPILDGLRARGQVIRAMRPIRPSLEDLFMRAVTDPATGEVLRPGAAPTRTENRP